MELGDQCTVKCVTSDLIAELDFKTKGFFSGQYHGVVGKIKKGSTGEVLYDISGTWTNELFIKPVKVKGETINGCSHLILCVYVFDLIGEGEGITLCSQGCRDSPKDCGT